MGAKYSLTLSPTEYHLDLDSSDTNLSIESDNHNLDVTTNKYQLNVEVDATTLSLSRVGGQGSQGPAGNTTISDLTSGEVQDGDFLRYNAATSSWENKPHTLTTASLVDVDNTGREDGALLLYDSTSSKYVATTQIANSNLYLIGGSF